MKSYLQCHCQFLTSVFCILLQYLKTSLFHALLGAFAKVKESQRMSDEGKMDQEEANGIRKRCRTVGFALQAEMNHFHQRREVDFKEMMQAYLRQQIAFYQRVGQQLERTLHMYDNLQSRWRLDCIGDTTLLWTDIQGFFYSQSWNFLIPDRMFLQEKQDIFISALKNVTFIPRNQQYSFL